MVVFHVNPAFNDSLSERLGSVIIYVAYVCTSYLENMINARQASINLSVPEGKFAVKTITIHCLLRTIGYKYHKNGFILCVVEFQIRFILNDNWLAFKMKKGSSN